MKKFASFWAVNWLIVCVLALSGGRVWADKGELVVVNLKPASGNGTVLGDRCNVRSRPSIKAEVVAQLNKGDQVTVVGSQSVTEAGKTRDWYNILLPENARCFVAASLVENGSITGDQVYVRCGPGQNYRDVGQLIRGAAVTVVDTKGDWVQIRPTPACTGWIAAELVAYTPVEPAPEPEPEPVVEVIPVAPVVEPAPLVEQLEVISTDPEVHVIYVIKTGIIRPVQETADAPAAYELLTPERQRIEHRISFLDAPADVDMARYLNRAVRVQGNQRWYRGDRYPILAADRIDVIW